MFRGVGFNKRLSECKFASVSTFTLIKNHNFMKLEKTFHSKFILKTQTEAVVAIREWSRTEAHQARLDLDRFKPLSAQNSFMRKQFFRSLLSEMKDSKCFILSQPYLKLLPTSRLSKNILFHYFWITFVSIQNDFSLWCLHVALSGASKLN